MRIILTGILAIQWMTVPVLLQSCCGGIGGDDVYYTIDDMSISVYGPGTTGSPTPSKLSDNSFLVSFKITLGALEHCHLSAL